MSFISNAYAQAPASADGIAGLIASPAPMFILMFVLMYFFMIRPQMKRQKEQKLMMEGLAKGDEVITAGGVLGKVTKVVDAYVTLEVGGTEMVVQKTAITTLLPKGTIKSL